MNRRRFLACLLALPAAPIIAKAERLLPAVSQNPARVIELSLRDRGISDFESTCLNSWAEFCEEPLPPIQPAEKYLMLSEVAMLEERRLFKEEICRIFRVPPEMVSDVSVDGVLLPD